MAVGDMFLKIKTARQGPIKGESRDADHTGEIDVVSWAWGMHAKTAMSGTGAASKATLDELDIVKHMDSASTALMMALRSNDLIKEALLTVRKAGSSPLEYVRITLGDARITSLTVESFEAELVEKLSFAFKSIDVQYTPQNEDGGAGGKMNFSDEIG